MKKNILIPAGIVAVVAIALVALPTRSASSRDSANAALPAAAEDHCIDLHPALARAHSTAKHALTQAALAIQNMEGMPGAEVEDPKILLDLESPSWLGIETREVTSELVQELKLPAERGVVVSRVTSDSPAAKAGLKEKDVITEVNGQRVEGSAQFRRMIHEIPPGRSAQLTVWRDGRAQTLSATLGKAEEGTRVWTNKAAPGTFAFRLPDVTEIPGIPSMDFDFDNGIMVTPGIHPRLGIDAEDISGQLGAYFGAPDGEGVLVRNVDPGSAAEKAGLKAGDVITSFNGERIHSLGDLRRKIIAKSDEKPAKLGVLRNKSELPLTVELPAAKTRTHKTMRSTNI
jgi:serine protease Do